jgi:hypothetical protein
MKQSPLIVLAFLLVCSSCKKDKTPVSSNEPSLIFTFKFDSAQQRLNNIGQPAVIPAGNAAQSPVFNSASVHYIELSPDQFTPLGSGAVLYRAPEVTTGGSNAIDYDQSVRAGNGQVFFKIPIKQLTAGTYKWLRISFAYQNFEVKIWVPAANTFIPATAASFIGFNTYIRSFKIKDSSITVNANKLQGFWAVEASTTIAGVNYGYVNSGQAPPGATTVVNPLFATSPIPPGSCVVTGSFAQPLTINPAAVKDVNITVSLSVNKSFEWKDIDGNGLFNPGDQVVDMGIRGMMISN